MSSLSTSFPINYFSCRFHRVTFHWAPCSFSTKIKGQPEEEFYATVSLVGYFSFRQDHPDPVPELQTIALVAFFNSKGLRKWSNRVGTGGTGGANVNKKGFLVTQLSSFLAIQGVPGSPMRGEKIKPKQRRNPFNSQSPP